MVKMVPYEAFACPCGSGDVVLRESYKPKTRGKLYYACPRSKPLEDTCKKILWKEERVRLLVGSPGASTTPIYSPGSSSTPIYSPGASTTPIYSPGSSSTPIYSPGASRNAECSNCKHLLDKITVLEAMLEMYKNPEQHTLNSAALLHEVYNDMGKLDLEYIFRLTRTSETATFIPKAITYESTTPKYPDWCMGDDYTVRFCPRADIFSSIKLGGKPIMSITDIDVGPNPNVTSTLEDNGNFRLINEVDKRVLWQSFDYPYVVLMPEASQRLVIRRRGQPYWNSGNLNNQTFEYMHQLEAYKINSTYNNKQWYVIYDLDQEYVDQEGNPLRTPWVLTSDGRIKLGLNSNYLTSEFCYGIETHMVHELIGRSPSISECFGKSFGNSSRNKPKNDMKLIWILIGTCIPLVILCLGLLWCRKKRMHRQEEERRKRDEYSLELTASESFEDVHRVESNGGKGNNLIVFSIASIMAATNDFSVDNKLGEGGFGPVYKGKLSDGREVAIKRLSRTSGQGLVEFKNELVTHSQAQHTPLVWGFLVVAFIYHFPCKSVKQVGIVVFSGYMPPEYLIGGTFSVKSDIFSFGVLVLEIISGKKNSSFSHLDPTSSLIGYAWKLWKQGDALELMDPSLASTCVVKCNGLKCL
ncbi:G-type lectin S-receptor-like serine/threonine-protein kinase [Tanacetum coccineum]